MEQEKNKTRPHTGFHKKTAIALLTTGAIDPNNRAIWSGVWAACREHDLHLVCYPGRLVRSPVEFESQRNVIYRMVDAQVIDGIVMMGGLNAWVDTESTYSFLKGFAPIPVVTTGIVLEGIPGVTVDNYHGMQAIVEHLIQVHNRRRIAFIRGQANHQEALERYQAYLDVLKQRQIPFDPELVYQGNFKESGGVEGVKTLLDDRHVDFDALVAASDNMAIGAMKTLQMRGIRIPTDVAVAGLNGEDQGLMITPPLTTAPLHFFEQAYQAASMVIQMIEGQQVPPKVVLPTQMTIRQSCGCSDPLVAHAEASPHTEKLDSFTDEIRMLDALVFGDSSQKMVLPQDETLQQVFPTLLKSFLAESQGKSEGEFLQLFSETISQTANAIDSFQRWHEIISLLRQFAISQLSDPASRLRIENLVQQVRIVIGESARRHYAYQVLKADEKLHILGEISQSLSVITNQSELIDVLERSLLLLDIPRCYLFMYADAEQPAGMARFIFAYENHQRVPLPESGLAFESRYLLPPGLLNANETLNLVVEPIYFREDQLGYAVIEARPSEEAIYEILGGQISASLKRTILSERNIRLYDEALQARKAAEEANLLKSRFLSMVSHELRTPLALIVGTLEMMLQEAQTGGLPPLPVPYRQDMEGIFTSSKHLSRLIGDVLDLASNQAGELRLNNEPLDLSSVFSEAAILGKSLAKEKNLQWRQEIPEKLPLVWGDRTRLRQVTINLLSNAVKFTEKGTVSLIVSLEDERIHVEVSDTGMGIPLEEQALIFDEFRRSERSVARGYGGMGLGLAITRRLIELHGGTIGVRSSGEDETGSTFFYDLPVMPDATAVRESRSRHHNTVLLLVENCADGERLQQHLEKKGFSVELMDISTNPDWISRAATQQPGAFVLDFHPVAERGWELVQLIKQYPGTSDIPVIFYNFAEDQSAGSTLELDFLTKPVASADLLDALERLGLKKNENDRSILVVDDDPKVLDMHVRMLEHISECQILRASNGKEALEIARQEKLALILLDLMMPEMDGFAVLAHLREEELNRTTPVIVLTAQILTTQDMHRLQEGVTAVLNKGLFSVDEVLSQVEGALNHSKRLNNQAARIVREAMAYIHEQYSEPLNRAELARHVAITERYLTHCFRQELGIPPIEYLNRYRVRQAKLLLEQGKLSITEIALEVGFSDSSYFNRVFRQETGQSPSAYQRGERSEQK